MKLGEYTLKLIETKKTKKSGNKFVFLFRFYYVFLKEFW